MKKIIFPLLAMLALVLTACGAATGTEAVPATQDNAETAALSTEAQLLLGSFQLEGTVLAITPEQAAELLPLWQVYNDLVTSDTAAQAEIDALVAQIHETMTEHQLLAIAEMQFTGEDILTVMQENGISMGASDQSAGTTSGSESSGGMPGGEPPMGGEMGGGDMSASASPEMGAPATGSDQSVGQVSGQASAASAGQIPSVMIEALIQLLETRAAS